MASSSSNIEQVKEEISYDVIPHVLTTDILLRLPVKSLARFLCVSKLWASTIRSKDFADSFMTRSSTRPYMVFNLCSTINFKNYFFSSYAHQDSDNGSSSSSSSSHRTANHDVTFPRHQTATMYQSVRGLVCFGPRYGFMVCNPSTRRFKILPRLVPKVMCRCEDTYFGYDPISDQYKVLWVNSPRSTVFGILGSDNEIQVFTLGDGEWRRLEDHRCPPLHFPSSMGTCINGVIYYMALTKIESDAEHILVCFDVRTEKFKLMKVPREGDFTSPLMNYKGNLAVALHRLFEVSTSFDLWILNDAEQVWSRKVFVLPPSWGDVVRSMNLRILEVCSVDDATDEIVIAPIEFLEPVYVLYYDPGRKSVRRVEIRGVTHHDLMKQRCSRIWTFPNHIESLMFL